MTGIMLVLFFATLIRSLPERWENSTAYTSPSCTVCDHMSADHVTTHRPYDIRNMRHSCARGCPQIKHFGTRLDMDFLHTSKNGSGQLAAKWVPYTILYLAFNQASFSLETSQQASARQYKESQYDVHTSTLILFSPYTDSPGTRFFVTKASSFPLAMNTPEKAC